VELFKWANGKKLSSWMGITIGRGEDKCLQNQAGGQPNELGEGIWVDPCWGALNELILEERKRRVKARQKQLRRFGKNLGDGKVEGVLGANYHDDSEGAVADNEDPGAICVLLGSGDEGEEED